jgi:L-fuconolactonase
MAEFCRANDSHWLVLDHLGKPFIRDRAYQSWCRDLEPIARLPHVVCKVSGLVTEAMNEAGEFDADELPIFLDATLELFGPQRLMFGSDWPVCLLAAPYERVAEIVDQWAARLSVAEREAIWGETAKRVYRL